MSKNSPAGSKPDVTQAFKPSPSRLNLRRGRVPLLVMVCGLVVGGLGAWVHTTTKESMGKMLAEGLQAILRSDVAALEGWIASQTQDVQSWSAREQVRENVLQLVKVSRDASDPRATLLASAALATFRRDLDSLTREETIDDYVVLDSSGLILASKTDALVGVRLEAEELAELENVLSGDVRIVGLFHETTLSQISESRTPHPLIAALAPVRVDVSVAQPFLDELFAGPETEERIIAALVFLIDPSDYFTEILSGPRLGTTGHTYAFNHAGLMLSECRSPADLKHMGLFTDPTRTSAVLTVHVRDPGGDMTEGYRPDVRLPSEWPLTEMAAAATEGQSGMNVVGYRDYRGVKVIGAWTWLPAYEFGVATEVNLAETNRVLKPIWLTFGAMLVLVVGGAAVIVIKTWINVRLRKRIHEVHQLGQYRLVEKIGEGGMGEVYRAQHAMLHRPTALKLLRGTSMTPESIGRFEREVQQTCQLSHPNTIEIYDFGRTPDDVFYYVMEFLEGLTLAQLVAMEGTIPPARAMYLLKQACGSLAEAHEIGLVHRDIKPQNIMLCERGGHYDVVKVLDFGIAKDVIEPEDADITSANMLAGTPRYIAPERLQDPQSSDPAADVFSLGAVAFLMLTGREAFLGSSVVEVCEQVLHAPVSKPSDCVDQPIPWALDDLILRCLSRDLDVRPPNAEEVLKALTVIPDPDPWDAEAARQWWHRNSNRIRAIRERSGPAFQSGVSSAALTSVTIVEDRPKSL